MKIKKTVPVIIFAASFTAFMALMIFSTQKIKLHTSAIPLEEPVVIIDAGHGGEDGGAVGENGTVEKNINLAISRDIADFICFCGFDYQMTREDDNALSTEGETVRKRKYNDMKLRLDMYDSSKSNVILSIHQNKFTDSSPTGTRLFYSPNNEKSLSLAESIKYSVKSLLQPENDYECKKAGDNIYLLKNTRQPAVIVECGFISNPKECSLLLDDEYQKQMSFAITMGFLAYYNTNF